MLHVTSETGRLRTILVHEPGREIDTMVPAMMEELLFDDILYGKGAREEHGRFRRVLQVLGIEVVKALDLLGEALAVDEARRWLGGIRLQDTPPDFHARLMEAPPEELAAALIGGVQADPPGSKGDLGSLYRVFPLPNYCFQRDPQVVLGDGVLFSPMSTKARWREALIARTIFHFHPRFASAPTLLDPFASTTSDAGFRDLMGCHFEGGDVLVLSPDVVAVGLSERTNRAGVEKLATALAAKENGPRWLVVVALPHTRAFMHLDTVMTPVDRDACLIFPPLLEEEGSESVRVYEIDLHGTCRDPMPTGGLLPCLASHGLDYEPILCGGGDPVAQQREQWTDGANALALAPGVICLYRRNLRTTEELARHGFRIVEAEDKLLGRAEVDPDAGERVCILLSSNELARARGGPHCLTHPLVRDDL